jgi:hypothetical protein
MSGRTTGYTVEPAGECVIGVATSAGYRLRRRRRHHDVRAGDLADQCHLHRHFRARLGIRPGRCAAAFAVS